jgi:hypothetical protein
MGIEAAQEQVDNQHWPRWRVWTIRIWYALLSLWTLGMAQWAARMGQAGPGEHFGYGSVTAWKLIALGGVFAICLTGGRSVVAFHALVVGWGAWFLSERLFPAPPQDETSILSIITTVMLWLLPLVLLRPHRRELMRLDLRPSAILLPLAVAAAVPLSMYSVRQGNLGISVDACMLGVVVAAQAVLAALRPRRSRWLPRFVALAAGSIGLLAVIWPHDLTSLGRGWGGALICWALLFAAAGELEARRDPTPGVQPATTPTTQPRLTPTG